jgi:hypothetical protein
MNSRTLATITCILAWAGLILQYYIMIANAEDNGLTFEQTTSRFLGYFTILTNFIVAFGLTHVLFTKKVLHQFFSRPLAQTAIGVYILIVGLGYNILLRHLWKPTGLQLIADEILHDAVPLLYTLYWYFFVPKQKIKWYNIIFWLIYPFFYVVFAFARGAVDGFYPYGFINVAELGFSQAVFNAAMLSIVFIGISALYIAISRAKSH